MHFIQMQQKRPRQQIQVTVHDTSTTIEYKTGKKTSLSLMGSAMHYK